MALFFASIFTFLFGVIVVWLGIMQSSVTRTYHLVWREIETRQHSQTWDLYYKWAKRLYEDNKFVRHTAAFELMKLADTFESVNEQARDCLRMYLDDPHPEHPVEKLVRDEVTAWLDNNNEDAQ